VRTLGSDNVQTNQLGPLRPHDGLGVLVVRNLQDYTFAGSRMPPVINQLRGGASIGDGLERRDFFLVVEVDPKNWTVE
jgi:hypothetical protein